MLPACLPSGPLPITRAISTALSRYSCLHPTPAHPQNHKLMSYSQIMASIEIPNIRPPEIAALQHSMKSHPDGFFHLARDGVLRSYDGNSCVIDYRRLDPKQVMAYLKTASAEVQDQIRWEEWEGVDGRAVHDEKLLWHPVEAMRPAILAESPVHGKGQGGEGQKPLASG